MSSEDHVEREHRCPECGTPIESAEPLSADLTTRLNPCNHIVRVGGHHE